MNGRNKEHLDLVRKKHVVQAQLDFFKIFEKGGGGVRMIEEPDAVWSVQEVIRQLAPMSVAGWEKVRIGGDGDGGYVMLDPGCGGIAYSLGVSPHSPWDLEMAEHGFKVYQYDASIDEQPDAHPNLFFHKYFVSGVRNDGIYKTLDRIIAENGHQGETDIILQMDVEGAEWEVLRHIRRETMMRFKQIVFEFHDIGILANRYSVLRKLRETHTPVHFHYNNNTPRCSYLPGPGFIYSEGAVEVSCVRNDALLFSECGDYFPTPLDQRNGDKYLSDIPIGYFDLLLREPW